MIAHNTHNMLFLNSSYALTLRIIKQFNLNFNNKLIKNKEIIFTSRPGDLNSKDDFYIIESDIVVIETSLSTYDKTLYSKI